MAHRVGCESEPTLLRPSAFSEIAAARYDTRNGRNRAPPERCKRLERSFDNAVDAAPARRAGATGTNRHRGMERTSAATAGQRAAGDHRCYHQGPVDDLAEAERPARTGNGGAGSRPQTRFQ